MVIGLATQDTGENAVKELSLDNIRFTKPVFHGDTIYVESEVLEKRESKSKPDRGIVKVRTIGYKQDGTLVMSYKRSVLVPKRGHGVERGLGQGRQQPKLAADQQARSAVAEAWRAKVLDRERQKLSAEFAAAFDSRRGGLPDDRLGPGCVAHPKLDTRRRRGG